MPVGATPQLLLSVHGLHNAGAVAKLSSVLYEHGASIAASKKVTLQDHFSLLMSVWLPPGGTAPADVAAALAAASGTAELGCAVQATLLDAPAAAPPAEPQQSTRRLLLECPQKPGIVLALTELLKDHSVGVTDMDAQTSTRGGAIWFRLECILQLPAGGVTPEELEEQLRWWTSSAEMGAELAFDALRTDRFQPLSHA